VGLLLALAALMAAFPLIGANDPLKQRADDPLVTRAGDPLVDRAGDPLVTRMNRFAATYRQFAEQHNRGVFDAALAKKLSRQWREVEASGEWPRGDR
jgi:hypothetical protein